MKTIAVVGASVAGVAAADALRSEGFEGRVVLIGDESHQPYTRPPLSKSVLAGRESADSVILPALDGVDLRLGDAAAGLDLERREVVTVTGERHPFDGLVIATGARARRVAAEGQDGERTLRTLDDAVALAESAARSGSAAILGSGVLGMEAASTLRALGLEVTVTDIAPPLQTLGSWISDLCVAAALDHGVRIARNTATAPLLGDRVVEGILLDDGTRLSADLTLTAAGDVPNIEWLTESGLAGPSGVLIDEFCLAAPGITAAGDIAASEPLAGGSSRRTPFWSSAREQGAIAARTLLGVSTRPIDRAHPYFWTEQFGMEIKIVGHIPRDRPPTTVLEGSVEDRSAVVQWTDDSGTPVAVASINFRMPMPKLRRLAGVAA